MDASALYSFMAQQKFAVIASLGPEGTPQSALVGIAVTPSCEIIFDTVRSSRKYPNLIASPACSLVLGWSAEQTVQFEGLATELEGAELQRYQDLYFAVWPDGRSRVSWPGITWFIVRPRWIRYSDFDRRPPSMEEFVATSSTLMHYPATDPEP